MTAQVETRSIGGVVAYATQVLGDAGVESAANDAELITCKVLGIGRTELHLQGAAGVDGNASRKIREMVTRRSDRRPLQHILGRMGFRSIDLAIDQRAMIPRPETELLAGAVIEHLEKSAATDDLEKSAMIEDLEKSAMDPNGRRGSGGSSSRHPQVLDMCTGSGAVALSIATEVPSARVSACDISLEALELARANCSTLGLQRRVRFLLGDLYAAIPAELKGKFDVIVANPPYIPTAEIAGLEPEVRDFDPRIALDGGADGLDVTRRILEQAGDWMRPGGLLAMELGSSQPCEVAELASQAELVALRPGTDYLGVERFFFALASAGTSAELEPDSVRPSDRVAIRGVRR